MTPQTVNAYYNPGMNEIVFPAAILRPPFFDMEADDAVNYGGIGAVIGHEIGHGFDDQGSKYDGNGNIDDWWTDADRAEFDGGARRSSSSTTASSRPAARPARQRRADDRREHRRPRRPDHRPQGVRALPRRRRAPVLDGLTGDQRLFIGWAQVWRTKIRDAEVATPARHRPALPARVPLQRRRPQHGRVLRGVRRRARRRDVARRGRARPHLVAVAEWWLRPA